MTAHRRIYCVTSNPHKAALMHEYISGAGFEPSTVELPLLEPQASSVQEVARIKARQAFTMLKMPLVVEDSGFCVDELSGFPGPFTKYVLESVGVTGLLRLAQTARSRACRFVCALAYVRADGTKRIFVDDRAMGVLAAEVDGSECPSAWSDVWRVFVPTGSLKAISALSVCEREELWKRWREHSVYAQLARALSDVVIDPAMEPNESWPNRCLVRDS